MTVSFQIRKKIWQSVKMGLHSFQPRNFRRHSLQGRRRCRIFGCPRQVCLDSSWRIQLLLQRWCRRGAWSWGVADGFQKILEAIHGNTVLALAASTHCKAKKRSLWVHHPQTKRSRMVYSLYFISIYRDVIRREVCRVGFDQRNPKPETRNPKPTVKVGFELRNPKPETRNRLWRLNFPRTDRNPKPETRNPKPETDSEDLYTFPRTDRNPKPETRNPKPTLKT